MTFKFSGITALPFALAAVLIVSNSYAADRLELEETAIQGAQELPKVLYVVPWKQTMMDDKPVELNTIADEVMTPVDRDVLRRKIKYYEGTGNIN